MLQFLKQNSYTIVKCILNQIAIAMLGLMVAFATARNETFLLIGSLFSIAFYLYLMYYMFWEIGGKDRIYEDSDKKTKTPLRAFWICLIANIPNIILAVLVIATRPFAETSEIAANTYFISNILSRALHGMYVGLIQLYSPYNPIGLFLVILPAPIISQIAYMFGNRNFRILGLFGIKQNLRDELR